MSNTIKIPSKFDHVDELVLRHAVRYCLDELFTFKTLHAKMSPDERRNLHEAYCKTLPQYNGSHHRRAADRWSLSDFSDRSARLMNRLVRRGWMNAHVSKVVYNKVKFSVPFAEHWD